MTPKPRSSALPSPVWGLDLSLTATGSVILASSHSVVETWKPPNLRGPTRLAWFREKVEDVLQRFQPRLTVLEGYGFSAQHSRAHSLGELGGVVRLALHGAGAPFLVVTPSSLKKYVTGKGNAPKAIMIREVYRRWAVELDDDNQADAYSLAQFGVDWLTKETKTFAEMRKKVEVHGAA